MENAIVILVNLNAKKKSKNCNNFATRQDCNEESHCKYVQESKKDCKENWSVDDDEEKRCNENYGQCVDGSCKQMCTCRGGKAVDEMCSIRAPQKCDECGADLLKVTMDNGEIMCVVWFPGVVVSEQCQHDNTNLWKEHERKGCEGEECIYGYCTDLDIVSGSTNIREDVCWLDFRLKSPSGVRSCELKDDDEIPDTPVQYIICRDPFKPLIPSEKSAYHIDSVDEGLTVWQSNSFCESGYEENPKQICKEVIGKSRDTKVDNEDVFHATDKQLLVDGSTPSHYCENRYIKDTDARPEFTFGNAIVTVTQKCEADKYCVLVPEVTSSILLRRFEDEDTECVTPIKTLEDCKNAAKIFADSFELKLIVSGGNSIVQIEVIDDNGKPGGCWFQAMEENKPDDHKLFFNLDKGKASNDDHKKLGITYLCHQSYLKQRGQKCDESYQCVPDDACEDGKCELVDDFNLPECVEDELVPKTCKCDDDTCLKHKHVCHDDKCLTSGKCINGESQDDKDTGCVCSKQNNDNPILCIQENKKNQLYCEYGSDEDPHCVLCKDHDGDKSDCNKTQNCFYDDSDKKCIAKTKCYVGSKAEDLDILDAVIDDDKCTGEEDNCILGPCPNEEGKTNEITFQQVAGSLLFLELELGSNNDDIVPEKECLEKCKLEIQKDMNNSPNWTCEFQRTESDDLEGTCTLTQELAACTVGGKNKKRCTCKNDDDDQVICEPNSVCNSGEADTCQDIEVCESKGTSNFAKGENGCYCEKTSSIFPKEVKFCEKSHDCDKVKGECIATEECEFPHDSNKTTCQCKTGSTLVAMCEIGNIGCTPKQCVDPPTDCDDSSTPAVFPLGSGKVCTCRDASNAVLGICTKDDAGCNKVVGCLPAECTDLAGVAFSPLLFGATCTCKGADFTDVDICTEGHNNCDSNRTKGSRCENGLNACATATIGTPCLCGDAPEEICTSIHSSCSPKATGAKCFSGLEICDASLTNTPCLCGPDVSDSDICESPSNTCTTADPAGTRCST
jgi:hypothetical protein